MTMEHYHSGGTKIYYKTITARPKGAEIPIGMAFRTIEAPIGYLPFYDVNDFDFSGGASIKERILANISLGLSSAASPHTLLIQQASVDFQFTGIDAESNNIQQKVRLDLIKYPFICAKGVFVESIMTALGGPAISSVANKLVKSRVKQFIISKGISSEAKTHLKRQGNIDTEKWLVNAP